MTDPRTDLKGRTGKPGSGLRTVMFDRPGRPAEPEPRRPTPSPLADARGEDFADRDDLEPIGVSNDGRSDVFATGTVHLRRDPRG